MSIYLTAQGFQKKTLTDVRSELEASYRQVFGVSCDLAPEGVLGQTIAIASKYLADHWEGAQEIYTARDPDTATGIDLDSVCAESGITRLAATAARVDSVFCWSLVGQPLTIPTGSQIKAASGTVTYSTPSDIVASTAALGPWTAVRLKLDPSIPDTASVELAVNGGTSYAAQKLPTNTLLHVATQLALTFSSSYPGVASAVAEDIGGEVFLTLYGSPTITVDSQAYILITGGSQQGTPASFVCDTPGLATVPAYTLDTIATPVTGWLYVSQPSAGVAGTDTESDTALRIRRLQGLRSGTATEDAIREALYRLDGVSKAIVTSNRTKAVDAEGRPPVSLECIVAGGEAQSIADAIWKTAPAGVETYGLTTKTVTGLDGLPHTVKFSIPQPVYAWVEVTIIYPNLEEVQETDIKTALKDAIVTWGLANMGLGDNMILQKFYAPIYTVKGIGQVSLRMALTATDTGTPVWDAVGPIAVASREYATFDASRVVVLP